MKKLTFKVSPPKSCSVVSLIKAIDKIPCRIYLDLKNGSVTVENVNDTMIDTVIELIGKYYTILGVDIDNTIQEPKCKKKEIEAEAVETPVTSEDTTTEVVETPNVEGTTVEVVETPAVEDTTAEVVESPSVTEDTTAKVVETKSTTKKVSNEEAALLEVIGFALDKLDSSKKVEDQVEAFLTDIGMSTTERMVTQAFIVACNIKKINYENVILELHEKYPKVNEDIIKRILKDTFKKWLTQYPTLVEKCYKISLIAVLKVFAKRFS